VGSYDRRIIKIKFLMRMAQMSYVVGAQNSIEDMRSLENSNALTALMRTVNWASYVGDESIAPNQFDGSYKQIKTWKGGRNILDLWATGSLTDISNAKALVDFIYLAFGRVIG